MIKIFFKKNISIKVDFHITEINKLNNKIKKHSYENKGLKY